jgi:hypothetical protein
MLTGIDLATLMLDFMGSNLIQALNTYPENTDKIVLSF